MTPEQAQRDQDHALVRQVIADLDAQAMMAAAHGDDESADIYHKRAYALARLLTGPETRRDVRQVVNAAKALVRLNRTTQITRFSPAIKEHAEDQLERSVRALEGTNET